VVDLSGITDLDESGIKMLSTRDELLNNRISRFRITGLRDEWKERIGTLDWPSLG
jgi:anti-anti-sigma regulatory factor